MIQNLLKTLEDKISVRKSLIQNLISWEEKVEEQKFFLMNLEESRKIFQAAVQITQTKLSDKISIIVSSALAAVFPEPYNFKIEFVPRRNITECDLLFERNDKTRSPLDSCGYGAADIASLALRVAYLKLDNEARGIMVLDEPLRNISAGRQEQASLMIRELSRKAGMQFLIVTHSAILAKHADKKFRVEQNDGISSLEEY